MTWWTQVLVSTIPALIVGIIGFFLKRTLTQIEQRQVTVEAAFKERCEKSDNRVERLETRLNNTLQELPLLYTLREDWLRSNADVSNKLDKIMDLLTEKGRTGNA